MEVMDMLLEKDSKRMAVVNQAVENVRMMIEEYTNDDLEQQYILYKIGGTLLMTTLETFDKQLLARDLNALGAAFPVMPEFKKA